MAQHFGALEVIRATWQPPVVATDTRRVETPVMVPVPAAPAPEVAPPKPVIVLATPPPLAKPPPPPVVDLQALALTPAQWPRQVSLTQPQIFSAVLHGKVIGSIKVPAGMAVQLLAVQEHALVVEYQGARHAVTPQATDLLRRVLAARALPPAPPVRIAATAPPARASAASPLISAKPPYGLYNQPLARNPDFPPPRNPAYAKIVQILARRTGEKARPPYRSQPLDFMACVKRYEALAAPDQRVKLTKELANDLRQAAWQFENGPIEGKYYALDAAHCAAKAALGSLKDKELTLAITETFIWPNYQLASVPGSWTFFMESRQIEELSNFYEGCGATDRAVVALKTLIALETKKKALNQADGARIALSRLYRKERQYAKASALLREVTDSALYRTREDIPALEAAAEKQAQAAKMKKKS